MLQFKNPQFRASLPNGEHFRVRGRIIRSGNFIRAFGNDFAVFYDDRAERFLSE